MPFLILSAGRDSNLLKQRRAMLQEAGYEVVNATDSPEMVNRLFNGDFDLVLLCATISDEEQRRLAGIVKGYTPSTPLVFIARPLGPMPSGDGILCDPERILETLRDTLAARAAARTTGSAGQQLVKAFSILQTMKEDGMS